jgi:hypothetical protein
MRILGALGTVSLVLAASVGPSSTAAEPADALGAISLADQRAIEVENSQLIALSPDGKKLAVSRPAGPEPSGLCIHDVATRGCPIHADHRGDALVRWVAGDHDLGEPREAGGRQRRGYIERGNPRVG